MYISLRDDIRAAIAALARETLAQQIPRTSYECGEALRCEERLARENHLSRDAPGCPVGVVPGARNCSLSPVTGTALAVGRDGVADCAAMANTLAGVPDQVISSDAGQLIVTALVDEDALIPAAFRVASLFTLFANALAMEVRLSPATVV